jgi:hypothetical protein
MEQYNLFGGVKGKATECSGTRANFPASERVIAAFHSGSASRFYRACEAEGYVPSTGYEKRLYESGMDLASSHPRLDRSQPSPRFNLTSFGEYTRGMDFNDTLRLANALARSGLPRVRVRGGEIVPIKEAPRDQIYAIGMKQREALEKMRREAEARKK